MISNEPPTPHPRGGPDVKSCQREGLDLGSFVQLKIRVGFSEFISQFDQCPPTIHVGH